MNQKMSPAENVLEVEIFEVEVYFYDSSGLHSRPKDVLLCRHVVFRSQSLQII